MTSHTPCPKPRRAVGLCISLCSVLALLAAEASARADTSVSVLDKNPVRELSHERDIQLSESVANVTETITFANAGRTAAELVYGFDLPPQAAVYDLVIEPAGGAKSRYGVVDAKAATRLVASPNGDTRPDLGLLRMVSVQEDGTNARRRYELRVYPIPGQLSTKVSLRWRSPVHLVAGRHQLRIPSRGQAPLLARSEIHLRTAMATGTIYAGGAELALRSSKGKKHSFFELPEGDLVIQAEPKSTRPQAYAEVALFPLGPTSGVAAVRVVLPAKTSHVVSRFSRVLLIVDVSRSMAEDGREAASQFVDALLTDMGTGAQVEAILYDRKATRVFESLQPGTKEVRGKILRAIRSAPGNNGSDLRNALQLARTVLGESATARKNDTLIAVVSDGIVPANLSGDDATFQLGPEVMADARLLSAVLVPPNAPLPAMTDHPMSRLAYQGRGRVAALHYADAGKMGTRLLRGLAQPVPLTAITVDLDRGRWVGADLKGSVGPGSSALALGYYRGNPPKRITIEAKQGGATLRLTARTVASKEARAWASMTLADSSIDSFPAAELPAANRRAFVKAAAALGVVTQASAAVVIDKSDAFASDRMDLAAKQGGQHYRRLAPPPENNSKSHKYQQFEVLARDTRSPFDSGETGKLDREIITRRMRTHAIPVARGCYDKLLRRNQKAGGTVLIRYELSRGEVHHVALTQLSLSLRPIRDCIVDAVYAMPIPRVRQGSDPEQISLVNYPLRFRLQKTGKGNIEEGTPKSDSKYIDTRDPLSGLPE